MALSGTPFIIAVLFMSSRLESAGGRTGYVLVPGGSWVALSNLYLTLALISLPQLISTESLGQG